MGQFRKRKWGNLVESADGFSVQVSVDGYPGMRIRYTEGPRTMDVFAEAMAKTIDMVLDRSSMVYWNPPHTRERMDDAKRQLILDRIAAALTYAGITFEVDGAFPKPGDELRRRQLLEQVRRMALMYSFPANRDRPAGRRPLRRNIHRPVSPTLTWLSWMRVAIVLLVLAQSCIWALAGWFGWETRYLMIGPDSPDVIHRERFAIACFLAAALNVIALMPFLLRVRWAWLLLVAAQIADVTFSFALMSTVSTDWWVVMTPAGMTTVLLFAWRRMQPSLAT